MTAIEINHIIALLVFFQFKHFIADFPLQTPFMLGKVKDGWDFLVPLAAHCLVHSAFTLVLLLVVKPELWWLSFIDFAVHFVMDRVKAGSRYLGRFRDKNKASYWNSLGFDQMFHHLTHYFIIYQIVTY